MKILHVMWSLGFGGIENLVFALCCEQQKNGLTPRVLIAQSGGPLEKKFQEYGIPILDANLKNGFDPGWSSASMIVGEMESADIIHLHAYSPVFARHSKLVKTPIAFTHHGNHALGRKTTWRDRVIFKLRSRFLQKAANYITFNSKFTAKQALKHFRFDKIPNTVVYNGIDVPTYENNGIRFENLNIDAKYHNRFIVGTTSRFAGFKRIDRLIKSFAGMKNKENCCLLLVGDGPLRPQFEQMVTDLGIAEQTQFTGFKANVSDYQRAMDACVFPSKGEPFGLVAVETLALGKPTLVMRDGGGIVEIIEPVEPDNIVDGVHGLTRRLTELRNQWQVGSLEDKQLISDRRARAQAFNVAQMTKKFSNVYSQCLNTGQAKD